MIKVGCCGFPTSMKKYFENFSLVELNSTFYQYPRIETVEGWREKAPENFEFTVKAHQDITHKARMKIEERSLQAFERMKQICKVLNAKILLFQTPGSFGPDGLLEAERFFREINREGLVLVWETRGLAWETAEIREKFGKILEKLNVSHVTDPFRIMPAYTSDVSYFRLHGLGERLYYYQYTDVELRKLRDLIAPYERHGKDVYVLFNNLAMFEDAMRFREFLSKGVFPKMPSLQSAIEKIRYPITKSVLVEKLGWRLVEKEEGNQVRLEAVVADLASRTFKNADELLRALKVCKEN